MSICLPFDAVVGLSALQLHTLANIGSELDAAEEQSCVIFSMLVEGLDETLRRTYQAAAEAARNADHLSEASTVWDKVGAFADDILTVLASLKELYPHCGTPQLYDLALDYKLASQQRSADSKEEASCLNENRIPAGLFPAMS